MRHSPHLPRSHYERENGFTLVEILVVIIIIGILAAIAIPIFLNQQRAARDSATTSDVRNLAATIQAAMAARPDADGVSLGAVPAAGEEFVVDVDGIIGAEQTSYAVRVEKKSGATDSSESMTVTKTEGTEISVFSTGEGQYVIRAWNQGGGEFRNASSALLYDSAQGGFLDGHPVADEKQPVADGSFEGNVNSSWHVSSPAYEVDSSQSRSGESSIRFTGEQHTEFLPREIVEVKSGESWEVSAWFKTEGERTSTAQVGGLRLQVSRDGGASWESVRMSNVSVPTEGWERHTIVQNIPSDVTHMRVRVAFTAMSGWSAWVDDVEMKKVRG